MVSETVFSATPPGDRQGFAPDGFFAARADHDALRISTPQQLSCVALIASVAPNIEQPN
jgi:hypothetical protein